MPTELVFFARVLAAVPSAQRVALSQSLLCEVAIADACRQSSGQAHPAYGDGTLTARLMKRKIAPLQFADDPEFLASLKIAADAVLNHTAG
jgi:hypothetical protein